MSIEVSLQKQGPVRIQAKISDYTFDIEITEDEAKELAGKLDLAVKYRQTLRNHPIACQGTPAAPSTP